MRLRASVAACAAASILVAMPAASALAASSDTPPDAAPTASLTADPAPSGLKVVKEGNKTVWLDWADVADATRYTVKVTVLSKPADVATASLGVTTYTGSSAKVTGLTNGVVYGFQVAATVAGKVTDYSAVVSGQSNPAPAPVIRLSDANPIEGYAGGIVDFDPVAGATTYRAVLKVIDDGGAAAPLPGAAAIQLNPTTATVSKLTLGAVYEVRIQALVDGQYTDSSNAAQLVGEARPNKAGTPSPGIVSSSSIQVKWAAATLADQATAVEGYDLTWGPAGTNNLTTEHLGADARSFTAANVVRGTTYQFQLVARNAAGTGLPSVITRIVAADKPSAVKSPNAVRLADGTSVDLDWKTPQDAGGGTITRYVVSTSPAAAGSKVVVDFADTSAKVTGLSADIDYKFTITAYTSGGGTSSVVGSLAHAPKVTGEPVLDADGTAVLTFAKLDNAKLSYVARATQVLPANLTKGGRSMLFSTNIIEPDSISCAASSCTAVFKGFGSVVNGEPWTFQVRATDAVNMFSNWTSVVPDAPADAASLVSAKKVKDDYVISYKGDWSKRADKGIYTMTINGRPVPTGTITVDGPKPGDQLVEFVGMGGSSSTLVDLPEDKHDDKSDD